MSSAETVTVTICTTDGQDVSFPVTEETTVLDGATEAGWTLVSLCGKGSCGVCHARVIEGGVTVDPYGDAAALSDDEREHAGVLLCCTHAVTDLRIAVPYERSRIIAGAVPERVATIVELTELPGDIIRLGLQVEADEFGSAMQFDAGQFAELTPPDGEEPRAYSFANTGNWDGAAQFVIKRRPGGYFSEYLWGRAAVGDRLGLRGPLGAFTLRENGLRPRWMVCGGTGFAPLISMLRRMAEWQEPQPATLILGVNTPDEVFANEEIEELHATLPGITTIVSVTQPDDEWDGEVGTAVDVLERQLTDYMGAGGRDVGSGHEKEAPDIYLCGSPGFLTAARACAVRGGVPDYQVYEERILAT